MTNIHDGRLVISGIAVREGISRNNRKYVAKELVKFAPTLIGRPILKDHKGTVDSTIGKVTDSQVVDGGRTVNYRGWIKGEDIIEKLKDGRISEVSIGAFSRRIVRDNDDETLQIPTDMEAMELSVTPIPGVQGTSILPENIVKSAIRSSTINDNTHIEIKKESQELNKKEDRKIMANIDLSSVPTEELDNLLEYAKQLEIIKRQREAISKQEITAKKKVENTFSDKLTQQARKMLEEGYIYDNVTKSFFKVDKSSVNAMHEQLDSKIRT